MKLWKIAGSITFKQFYEGISHCEQERLGQNSKIYIKNSNIYIQEKTEIEKIVGCMQGCGVDVARSQRYLGGVGLLRTLEVGAGYFYPTPAPKVQLNDFHTSHS